MINIRQNVFETNSSSSHSFTLTFNALDKAMLGTIAPNEKGQIVFTGGNFTGSEFAVGSPQNKANLIAANIVVYGDADLKERFEKVIKEHTGATEIIYDVRPMIIDGKTPNTFYSPKFNHMYSYHYDEETDEESEISFNDILADDKLMKTFIFSDSAHVDVGIHEC